MGNDGYQQGPRPDVSGPTGIPGKTSNSISPTSAAAIENAYIEGRGHCAQGTETGCFLNPSQRALLVNAYQQEVLAAQQQYSAALTEIKFDRLIQKEEEFPMWMGIMLDVIGGQLLTGLTAAMKMLQNGDDSLITSGLEAMHRLQTTEHSLSAPAESMRSFVQSVDLSSVNFILKTGIDETKKAVKSSAPKSSDEKAVTLSYIDRLQETSVVAWEQQRQGPPGQATDAEMIVLFHSFKAKMGHSTPRYKAALEEKIQRYRASPVSRIGRDKAYATRDADVTDVGHGGMTTRDTKVVWVQFSEDLPPELYYYKLDASPRQNDHTMENLDIPMIKSEDRFKWSTPVEPEFVETALARHMDIWKTPPELKTPARPLTDLRQFTEPKAPTRQDGAVRPITDLRQFTEPKALKREDGDARPITDLRQFTEPKAPKREHGATKPKSFEPQHDPASIHIPSALVLR